MTTDNQQTLKKNLKVYVEVIASFDLDGKMTPHRIRTEDGEVFPVDKVKDARPGPALKAGGYGMRYTVVISGRESYLFYAQERDRNGQGKWFLEAK